MEREEQRFARFIADLALDPGKLAHYMEDPEAAMQAAGLDDDEKGVLRTGSFGFICEFLGAGARPIPGTEQAGPGSGPVSGSSGGPGQ
jgi:hypothetical protein